jgi:hypothetical protein
MEDMPTNLFGKIWVPSIRLALLDSVRAMMATNPFHLRGFLLDAEMNGRNFAVMTFERRSTVFRRLHGLYVDFNAIMASCLVEASPISLEIIWIIGSAVMVERATGNLEGAEAHRRALLTLLSRDKAVPHHHGDAILRLRIINLLTGIGIPEVYTGATDSGSIAIKWKERLRNLQRSGQRPPPRITTSSSLLNSTSLRIQASRLEMSAVRWELAGLFTAIIALYEFRNYPAAAALFIDVCILPYGAQNPFFSMFEVMVPSFPSFIVAYLTARYVAARYEAVTPMNNTTSRKRLFTMEPEEIWELVELTMLLSLSNRQKVTDALWAGVDRAARNEGVFVSLDEDTIYGSYLEIAIQCQGDPLSAVAAYLTE